MGFRTAYEQGKHNAFIAAQMTSYYDTFEKLYERCEGQNKYKSAEKRGEYLDGVVYMLAAKGFTPESEKETENYRLEVRSTEGHIWDGFNISNITIAKYREELRSLKNDLIDGHNPASQIHVFVSEDGTFTDDMTCIEVVDVPSSEIVKEEKKPMEEKLYLVFKEWDGETTLDHKHVFKNTENGIQEAREYADCFLRTKQIEGYMLYTKDEKQHMKDLIVTFEESRKAIQKETEKETENTTHMHSLVYDTKDHTYIKHEYVECSCEEAYLLALNSNEEYCAFVTISCRELLRGVKPSHLSKKETEKETEKESEKEEEKPTMKLYDVYLNSSYMGELKAASPVSALEATIQKYAAKGGDIRQIDKAKVSYGYNTSWYYTVKLTRGGELKYTQVG